jgi:hypothetical protein
MVDRIFSIGGVGQADIDKQRASSSLIPTEDSHSDDSMFELDDEGEHVELLRFK